MSTLDCSSSEEAGCRGYNPLLRIPRAWHVDIFQNQYGGDRFAADATWSGDTHDGKNNILITGKIVTSP